MNGKQSWTTWAAIAVLLIVFGVVTALWSTITSGFELPTPSFGGAVSAPSIAETEPIHLELPELLGGEELTLSPFAALGGLAGLFVVLTAGLGGVLALNAVLADRTTQNTVESEEYKQNVSELESMQKEQLKALQEGRKAKAPPEHSLPRWSTISTSLIILMFVWFVAMIINGTLFPEGELIRDGELIRTTPIVVWTMLAITAVVLFFVARPRWILSSNSDYGAIPWDTIAVIITGLLIVGLGIGAMVFFIGPLG